MESAPRVPPSLRKDRRDVCVPRGYNIFNFNAPPAAVHCVVAGHSRDNNILLCYAIKFDRRRKTAASRTEEKRRFSKRERKKKKKYIRTGRYSNNNTEIVFQSRPRGDATQWPAKWPDDRDWSIVRLRTFARFGSDERKKKNIYNKK